MGLEAVSFLNDLDVANPTEGDARSEGDDHFRNLKIGLKATFPGMAGRAWRVQSKGSGYTVVATDNMTVVRGTAGITLTLTAVATLGNGFVFIVEAAGGAVVLDPAGAELVNGVATVTVSDGARALVTCDGSAWAAYLLPALGGALNVTGTGVELNSQVAQLGIISPAQITANTNDYAPTGLSTSSVLRINSDARRNLTGLTGGTSGRRLTIHNVGTFPILFKREDSGSTAANRFAFGCSLGGGQTLELEYDATSSRWRARALPEPIGTIKDFGGGTIPEDYLLCDGAAISRTTYAAYFNEVGTVHGAGDGATTVNVPDYRDRATIGAGAGTTAETVASVDVDTTNDQLTVVSNLDKWITGMKVQLTTTSGLPAPLAVLTDYWIIRVSATLIKLATTLANAQNGIPINLTTQGSGDHTVTHTLAVRVLGEKGGEDTHAMSSTEALAHAHTQSAHDHAYGGNTGTGGAIPTLAGDKTAFAFTTSSVAPAIQSTGGNAAMNITGPYGVVNKIIRVF